MKQEQHSARRFFRRLSIQQKLTVLLGLQVAVLLVWYGAVLSIQRQEVVQAGIYGNEQLALKMHNMMENDLETLAAVSAFPVLRDSNGISTDIYKHFTSEPYEMDFPYQIVRSFTNTATSILDINQSVSQVAVVNLAGKGFLVERNVMWGNSVMITIDMEQAWVADAMDARGKASGIMPLSPEALGYHGAENSMYCARAIVNAEQVQPVGLTVVGVSRRSIERFFETNRTDASQVFQILDAQGRPVAGLDADLGIAWAGMPGGINTMQQALDGTPCIVSVSAREDLGFCVVVATPEEALYHTIGTYTVVLYVMIALVIAASVILSIVIVQSIRSPIKMLLATIDAYADGDFSATATEDTSDELGQIAGSLNHMAGRVATLIDEVYVQQIEKKDLEIQALKAQVNPHFLYNSLESARMQAYQNKDTAVAETLLLLSDILRYGLVSSNKPVSLAMEMENIREYVAINNLRYHGVIDLIMSVEEGCGDCLLPRVTLQPLVENCIKHGFARGAHGGSITVFGYLDGTDCVIRVHDDGCGVSVDRLEALKERLWAKHDERPDDAGIGLYNVHRRLQLMFGNVYGLRLFSVEGKGFAVEIHIPAKGEGMT